MTDSRESWVETENTQHYTPDSDPNRDEAWVQTQNTQQYASDSDPDTAEEFVETENSQDNDQYPYGIADL